MFQGFNRHCTFDFVGFYKVSKGTPLAEKLQNVKSEGELILNLCLKLRALLYARIQQHIAITCQVSAARWQNTKGFSLKSEDNSGEQFETEAEIFKIA